MKKAIFFAIFLAGCQTDDAVDMKQAEAKCREWVSTGVEKNYSDCVRTTSRNYKTLRAVSASHVAAQPQPIYSPPAAPVPNYDQQAPLPNILPPTIRCQTYGRQTTCQ